MCTRQLNQDPLENLFSIIRQKGGKCDNPTSIQFARLFKQVCCQALLNPKVSANCEFDLATALATGVSIKAKKGDAIIAPQRSAVGVECRILPSLGSHSQTNSCLEENGLYYVSGYLLRKLLKFHNCEHCELLLTDIEPSFDSKTVYLRQRAYSTKSGHCAVICASYSFSEYITQCEAIFMTCYEQHKSEYGVINSIVMELMNIVVPTARDQFPLLKFLRLFVRMRVYYLLKFQNRAFLEKNAIRKSNKLKKLEKFKNV